MNRTANSVLRALLNVALVILLSCLGAAAQGQGPQGGPPKKVTLIVKTAKGLSKAESDAVTAAHGGTPKRSIDKLGLQIIEVPEQAAAAIADNLRKDAAIALVETNKTRKLQGFPSDALVGNQWALPKIKWDDVYGTVIPQGSATIAILDTGIDGSHSDLIGSLIPGTSFLDSDTSDGLTDPNGHGTFLAGIVAARTNNLTGIAGVAFDRVQMMPVRVLDSAGLGQDSDIIEGVLWATDHGANVILMAFSSPDFSDSLQAAIDYAWDHNVVVVAAAGNDASGATAFPAGDRGVIGVAGTDENDVPVISSNFGKSIFLGAPGQNILGTYPGNSYATWTGTSASAAIVAGSAALMHAVDPTLSNGVIIGRLARNADPAGTQAQTGNGRVQLARALADTNTDSIKPAGDAPLGGGGPFVGPYRAASGSFAYSSATASVTLAPTASTAFSISVTAPKNNGAFTASLVYATTGGTTIGIGAGANQISLTSNTKSFSTGASPSGTDDTQPFTVGVTVGSGVAGGTYHFKATASETCNCISDGSGQGFDVVVPSATTTATTVTSSGNPSIYGQAVTFTATVSSASTPTGSLSFVIDGGGPITGTVGGTTSTTATWTYTTSALTAATHTVTANYVHTGTFVDSSGALSGGQVVNKANAVIVVTPYSVAYDGQPHTATVTSITGVNGETGSSVGTINVSGTTHTNFGTYNDSWSFTPTGNYNTYSGSTAITNSIGKANAVIVVTPYSVTYDGQPHTATVTSITGVNGETGSSVGTVDVSGTTHTNFGSYNDSWSFTPTVNYNTYSGSTAITDSIGKANATFTVTPYTVLYDGAPHTATVGTITGVNGETGAAVGTIALNTTHTDAGTYNTDSWSFTGTANYNNIASTTITNTINKADAVVTVSGFTGLYDGAAHGATAVIVGVDAGGAATGSSFNSSSFTSVPGGTANWTFTGGTNYNNQSGTASIVINKASSTTTTVGAGPFTYDGATHSGGSGTVTGVGGLNTTATSVTYTGDQVNAGTYYVTAHYSGDANHDPSDGSAVGIVIDKASSATTTVGAGPFTYDGTTHSGGSGTVTGAGGLSTTATSVTYTGDQVNAGTYYVTAHYAGDANHNPSNGSPVGIVINKADAVVTVSGFTGPYDGSAHGVTAVIVGVDAGGAATGSSFNSSSFTSVPGGTANWTFTGGTNYNNQSGTASIVINKASSTTTTVGAGPFTYDGTTHSGGSGTVTGAGGLSTTATSVTYTGDQVNAGTYYVTAHYAGDANHDPSDGSAVGIVIDKASSTTTTVGAGPFTYDGTTHNGGSGTVTGAGGLSTTATSLTYTGDQVNAGTYYVTAHYAGDANHNPSNGSPVGIVINKADAVVTVSGFTGLYDGAAHGATVVIVGVDAGGAATGSSFNSSSFTNVPGGTANWTFTGGTNYNNQSGTVSIVINKASSTTTTVGAGPFTYDGATHSGGSGTVTGVGGLNTTATSVTYTGDQVNAGTYYVTAHYAGDANHDPSDGSAVGIVIDKASSTTTTVGAGPFTYDGTTHSGGSGTVTGVGGLNTTATSVTYTGSQVNAGTYYVTAHYAGDANHNPSDGSPVGIIINKADAVVTVSGFTGLYNGTAHGATAVIVGVDAGGAATGSSFNSSSFKNVPGGTASWTFTGGTNYNNQSGTAPIVINKVNAVISVTPYGVIYDGAAHTAMGTAKGVLNESLSGLVLSGTTHVNANSYTTDPWTFTDVTGNYNNASGTVSDSIAKANANCTVNGYGPLPYDAAAHGAIGSCTGFDAGGAAMGGALSLGASFTNFPGGNATWSFVGGSNYNNAGGTVAIAITKAPLTVTMTSPGSGALSSAGGSINLLGNVSGLVGGQNIGFTWTFDALNPASGTSSGSSIVKTQTLAAGVYQVKLTVNPGGTDTNYTTADTNKVGTNLDNAFIVVYDPSGGFVTGGGWILSQASGLRFMSVSGKADFGFVSKYQKGATIPTGETEFNFSVATMKFQSTSYDWLVVAGARAQYKGLGKINGAGNYGFLLTATDSGINGGGNLDKFRIKIWDKNNGDLVVYDNAPGSDDVDTSNGTVLSAPNGNGSIVIHK